MTRSFPRRLCACLRFETEKLLSRRLTWIVLLATAASTIFAGITAGSGAEPKASFVLFAAMLETGFFVATFFLVIMGAVSVNEEESSGALRAVMLRPIGRVEFVVAKALTLALFVGIVLLVNVLVAWLWVVTHGGFGPATIDFEGLDAVSVFDAATLRGFTMKLCLAAVPGAVAATWFGVVVSVVVEGSGAAVAIGVFCLGALKTLREVNEEIGAWFFTHHVARPIELLGELGRAIEENANVVRDLGPFSEEVVVPSLWAAGFGLLAVVLFARKEIRC